MEIETKNLFALVVKKGDREYRFEMTHGSPADEAYGAAAGFVSFFAEIINEHAKKLQQEEKPEEQKEGVEDECVQESAKNI